MHRLHEQQQEKRGQPAQQHQDGANKSSDTHPQQVAIAFWLRWWVRKWKWIWIRGRAGPSIIWAIGWIGRRNWRPGCIPLVRRRRNRKIGIARSRLCVADDGRRKCL